MYSLCRSLFRLVKYAPKPLSHLLKTAKHRMLHKNWYAGNYMWFRREFGTWLIGRSDHLIDALLLDEPRTWNYVKKLVTGGEINSMLDIGAHIGGYCVVLGRKIPVVAIEPMPDTYMILNLNIKLNESDVEALRAAAYDGSNPTVRLSRSPLHSGADAITQDGTIEVRAYTVDELWKRFGPFDLIKIDVEGAETKVLRGLSENPSYLVVEVRPNTIAYIINSLKRKYRVLFLEKLLRAKGVWNVIFKSKN